MDAMTECGDDLGGDYETGVGDEMVETDGMVDNVGYMGGEERLLVNNLCGLADELKHNLQSGKFLIFLVFLQGFYVLLISRWWC